MPNIVIGGLDQEMQERLPPELSSQFRPLFKDIFWLGMKWHEYATLFGEKSNFELLHRTASYLFQIIDDTMWDDMILHLSRLVGPGKTMGKENLTIRRIPELIQDSVLRGEIQALVDSCQLHCAFVTDHRNKRLAHYDLEVATQNLEAGLSGVSRVEMRRALESLQSIMQTIFAHYANVHFDFDPSLRTDNAEALIRALGRAERAAVAR